MKRTSEKSRLEVTHGRDESVDREFLCAEAGMASHLESHPRDDKNRDRDGEMKRKNIVRKVI